MQVAFISDIHANFIALQSVIRKLRSAGIQQIYHVGDLVGYYSRANETLDMLRQEKITGVLGNHDYLALGGILLKKGKLSDSARTEVESIFNNPSNVNAIEVLKLTIDNLSRENIEYLFSLQPERIVEIQNLRVLLVHGTPSWFGNPIADYTFENTVFELQFKEKMHENNIQVVVTGHTHVPYIVPIKKWAQYVLNAGSVGQPRDGMPFASCLIMDVEESVITDVRIIRVMYNIYEAQATDFGTIPIEVIKRLNFGL